MTQTSLQEWFAAMPPTKFERPGRGAPGAFDIARSFDQDIPRVERAATMPRTTKPAHEMPASVETGADDDVDLGELVEQLFRQCHARGLPTRDIEHALEPLLVQSEGGGDAGVPQRIGAEDDEPLDDEVIERVMRHAKAKLSPSAAEGLEDILRSAPGADDDLPEPLRGTKEGERLREYLDGLDRHSISDRLEAADAVGEAVELMRKTAGSAGDRRRAARDMPPPFPGRPTPGGYPLPGRQERSGIDRKRMAGDSSAPQASTKQFAKFLGLRKRDLPGVAW
jgi:hypothetical protein